MKALYVEDNKINAVVLKRLLKNVVPVHLVYNGKQALEIANDTSFDIVLMDINLGAGEMDGGQVMKKLRKLSTYKSTPIFAVTAYAQPEDERKFLDMGFDAYFAKPIEIETLREHIAGLFKSLD